MCQGWTWWRPTALACGQATILTLAATPGFYQMLLAHAVKYRVGRVGEIIILIYESLNGCHQTSTNKTMPDRYNQLSKKYIFWSFIFFSEPRETSPAQTSVIIILTSWFGLVEACTVNCQVIKRALKQKNKDMCNWCLRSQKCIHLRDNIAEWKEHLSRTKRSEL